MTGTLHVERLRSGEGQPDDYKVVEQAGLPPWGTEARLAVVGTPVPRVEGEEKVTGRARFAYDVRLPGQLYARVLRSPYPHARLKRVDTTRAVAVRLGARRDGTLTAIDARIEQSVGAHLVGGEGSNTSGLYQRLYRCPNVRTEQVAVYTNTGPAVAFRAPGYVEAAFALEQAMDELARALKIDPLGLRLRNYAERDQKRDKPYTTPQSLRLCYQKATDAFGWRTYQRPAAPRQGPQRRGIGMAAHEWGGSGYPPGYAWVKLNADGTADVVTGSQDIGTGTRTALSQVAAEEMGLPLERYPALAEAVALAATPQLRNMATIGGNLLQRPRCWYFRNHLFHCWLKGGEECQARDGQNEQHALFGAEASPCVAVHPSDPATALLALDAAVRLRGPGGERLVPLEQLFALPEAQRRSETTVHPDELLVSIHLPPPPPGARSVYLKAMDRKIWAFALVSVAASLRLQGDSGGQRIQEARIVLGGVAPIPWRSAAAERVLTGAEPNEQTFAQAVNAALADAQPLAHNAYKVNLAKALLRRALVSLVSEHS